LSYSALSMLGIFTISIRHPRIFGDV